MKALLSFIILSTCLQVESHAQSTKYPSSSWKRITVNCKVGYVDPEGTVMIEPQFENAGPFNNGVAFVWYFIGREEDRSSMPLGEEYKSYERFGLKGNRRTGIIDSTGKYIVEPKVNFNGTTFRKGVSLVSINGTIEIVDKNGEIVHAGSEVMQGGNRKVLIPARYNQELPRRWCFINPVKQLIMGPFEECKPFSEGLALVRIGKKFAYVNRVGDLVISPRFSTASSFHQGTAVVSVEKGENAYSPTSYGIIDSTGRFVIPPNYTWLGVPSDGRVPYRNEKNGLTLYGFLNMKGEVVVNAQYEQVSQFSEGLASVRINGKAGYIDLNGQIVIPCKYTVARAFQNGSAFVTIGKNKSALINTEGNILWGPTKTSNCQ